MGRYDNDIFDDIVNWIGGAFDRAAARKEAHKMEKQAAQGRQTYYVALCKAIDKDDLPKIQLFLNEITGKKDASVDTDLQAAFRAAHKITADQKPSWRSMARIWYTMPCKMAD